MGNPTVSFLKLRPLRNLHSSQYWSQQNPYWVGFAQRWVAQRLGRPRRRQRHSALFFITEASMANGTLETLIVSKWISRNVESCGFNMMARRHTSLVRHKNGPTPDFLGTGMEEEGQCFGQQGHLILFRWISSFGVGLKSTWKGLRDLNT